MSYVNPATVVSPKAYVQNVKVLYDLGPASWSAAKLLWNGQEALGLRWNGDPDQPGIGNPQSRGVATWFIVPKEVESSILEALTLLGREKKDILLAGYQEMAADTEREQEAEEWSTALIGDAFETR